MVASGAVLLDSRLGFPIVARPVKHANRSTALHIIYPAAHSAAVCRCVASHPLDRSAGEGRGRRAYFEPSHVAGDGSPTTPETFQAGHCPLFLRQRALRSRQVQRLCFGVFDREQSSCADSASLHATPMNKPYWYRIRVEGQLGDCWSDWFDGLMVDSNADHQPTLSGWISDQSALLGVLSRIPIST